MSLEARLAKLEHRVKTFSIATDGAGIDWPVYKFKSIENDSDKPHAAQLTELEHQWRNCQLLGDGSTVRTSGSMHDGWSVQSAVESAGTAGTPPPPPPPGCAANLQVVISGVTLCTCVLGPVGRYYNFAADISGTYILPLDEGSVAPDGCSWTLDIADFGSTDAWLESDCSGGVIDHRLFTLELFIDRLGDGTYELSVFDRTSFSWVYFETTGITLGDTWTSDLACGVAPSQFGPGWFAAAYGGSAVVTAV